MTDDIVKRLHGFHGLPRCVDDNCFACDAADEIESLRKEVTHWKHRTEQLARYIKRHHDVPNKGCRCVACKVVREVEKNS